MSAFFDWASKTPIANVVLVAVLCLLVIMILVTVVLCTIAFFTRVPFEFFGHKVWKSGVTVETRVFDLDKPSSFWDGTPGDRSKDSPVTFTEIFTEPPRVLLSLVKVDAGDGIVRRADSGEPHENGLYYTG